MPKLDFPFLTRAVTATLLAAMLFGCSAESKKTRHLGKADGYFAAGDYEKAEIEYKNVLQLGGRNPRAIGRLGIIYLEQGRLGQSLRYLKTASDLEPENVDLKLKLGYLYLGINNLAEARACAAFVLDRRPQDADAPMLLAESAITAKEAAEARVRLRKLPLPVMSNAPILAALGLLDLREQKLGAAQTVLEMASQADPKNSAAAVTLGRLYWAQKDLARAEKFLAVAAENSPPRSLIRLQQVLFNLQNGHMEAAKGLLAEMNRKTPDFLQPYVVRANIAVSEKKYDESIVQLDKVLARDSEHPEALLLSAQARMAMGDKKRTVAILEKAASLFSQTAQIHYQLGTAYADNGDLDKASSSFIQAVKLSPNFQEAIISLARVHIRQANIGPAIISLKALIAKAPGNTEARLLLADAYRGQGSLEEALELYRQLGASLPRNPQLALQSGMVLLRQGRKTEARQAFNQAIDYSPDFLPALEQLVDLDIADKHYAAARTRLETQVAKTPNNAALHLLLAKTYLQQPNLEKAEAALRKTIELQPETTLAYMLLGQLYVETNQIDRAVTNLQLAAEKNPNNSSAIMLVGTLQERQHNYDAAKASYEKVLTINPKAGGALNNLAYLYSERFADLGKAQDMAQRARELLPNEGGVADTLGWILYRQRQYPRALTLLQESAEKLPDNAEIRFHLGMAYYMMGEEEPARTALERAVQLSKDFKGAEQARDALSILTIDTGKSGASDAAAVEQMLAGRREDPIALSRLGDLYERKGDPGKAIAAYEAALKINAGNVSTALSLIRLYRTRSETAKAFELAKTMRKLAPNDPRVAHALGRLTYEAREFPRSFSLLQEAARRRTNDAELLYDLAEASYSVGQISTAETALQDALQASSTFSRAAKAREFLQMLAFAQTMESPKAMERAETLLKSDPSNVPALMIRAARDEQKRDLKSAQETYEKILERLPDFSPAAKRLAILYALQSENNPQSTTIATKARIAFPTDPDVAKAAGIITFRQGDFSRAASLLQESARNRTDDAEVMYYLGLCQYRLKDVAAGARSMQRALELGLPEKLDKEARLTMNPSKG